MSDDEPRQVALDGTEATRYVPVERNVAALARSVVHASAARAADGDLDADPEALANLAVDLSEALHREDLETEQVAEFTDDEGSA